ncbi:DUF1028 domain-containing protein [Halotalea alkalilenta]|uniref:Fimbrial assembly protein FimA n=1 Tax=Halotalea alkalilenta TaxID=376489 RepID=A0A172YBL7_9GAMM|nr:DUF1028 domain-containing protein [Halotalea alkalilenta]ANF56639.1 fimbrial assembly protein FimA [Halotalea alkalilenta]
MTFSIAARCAQTGELGCAVVSSSICVTSRCAFVSPDGAVLTQNVTQPALGIQALALLAEGLDPQRAIERLLQDEPYPQWRQLSVIDAHGRSAAFDGERALGVVGRSIGQDCLAAGNLLADAGVPQAMVNAFERSTGALAERLVVALEAGLAHGGEAGPVHSAGIKVARPGYAWPVVDLRVDWGDAPIAGVRELWTRYALEVEDYLTRANAPDAAPSYGVPGDD